MKIFLFRFVQNVRFVPPFFTLMLMPLKHKFFPHDFGYLLNNLLFFFFTSVTRLLRLVRYTTQVSKALSHGIQTNEFDQFSRTSFPQFGFGLFENISPSFSSSGKIVETTPRERSEWILFLFGTKCLQSSLKTCQIFKSKK